MKSNRCMDEPRMLRGQLQHATIRGWRDSRYDDRLHPRGTRPLDQAAAVSILVSVEMDVAVDHSASAEPAIVPIAHARVHELRAMWRNTRMIVLCAISAALYAAILVPFKVVPLIPGVTELRPANAIPIVCSFLFGPAAAWGSAIGNMIGDFFGGVSPGD